LLLACDAQNQYTSLATETQTALSLQRLAHSLRALYRTLIGEDPEPESTDSEPLDLHALIQALSDETSPSDIHDDWALERECEIARLQKENEELRRRLGIDPASLQEKGIVLDMDREGGGIARYASLRSEAARRQSESASSVGSSRFSAWGFDNESPRENSAPWSGWEINMAQQQQQQPSQQQQQSHAQSTQPLQVSNGPPLQRALDLQGGMRMQQPRRPPMFARGAGPAPPVSVGPNRNIPPSQWSQQVWSQGGSTLNLSR